MRLVYSIKRYAALKLKEIEFRFRMWNRAREISRAYDPGKPLAVRPVRPRKLKTPKITSVPKMLRADKPARAEKRITKTIRAPKAERIPKNILRVPKIGAPVFQNIKSYAVKGLKAAAAVAVLFAVGYGVARVIPHLAVAADERLAAADAAYEHHTSFILDDLPETAVMPEGFGEPIVYPAGAADIAARPATAAAANNSAALVEHFVRRMPRGFSELLILVDKAGRVMYILRDGAAGWSIARAYPISTGEVAGPKRVEGDKKTPQGEYFIVGRKHRSELTHVYGPAAFILDYPNPEDRAAGFTGHGIWIHGSDLGDIPPHFTAGCVATSNQDILDFASIVRDWAGVPVIILSGEETPADHFAAIDFERVASRRADVAARHRAQEEMFADIVMRWRDAWASKDIEAYTQFYSTATFANGQQRWEDYRAHKLRTFAMYEYINIDITNLTLTELTQNSATVKFNQVYSTNLNRIVNAKRLIFRRERGEWRIHREIPFPQEELLL